MKSRERSLSDLGRFAGLALCALLALAGCGGGGGGNHSQPAATVQSIEVTPPTSSIAVGTTAQLKATAVWSNNQQTDVTSSAAWSSSNTADATVGAGNGQVHSLGIGAATITASLNGVSGTASVVVSAAALVSIALTPPSQSLALGTSTQLTATGTFSDGTTQNISSDVTWSSSDSGVGSVSSSGLVQTVTLGTTTITATCSVVSVCGSINGSTNVIVTAAVLQSIQVSPNEPSIALGLTQQFTATGLYGDGTHQDVTGSVTWASASTSVATVSNSNGSSGLATSVGVGTTNIVAVLGSVASAPVPFTVTAATLVSIAITPPTASIPAGLTQQFTATGTYTDSSTQNVTTAAHWMSSDTSVATIVNYGVVNGASTGTTTITAAVGTVSATATLVVTPGALAVIGVTAKYMTVPLGLAVQFKAIGLYTDGSTVDLTNSVTWMSDQTSVATISNAVDSWGLATPAGVGTANITATLGSMVSSNFPLKVTNATLVSLAVSPMTASAAAGASQQFTVAGTYSDNSTYDLTGVVTWLSSDITIAVMSNNPPSAGLAGAVQPGIASITATYGTVTSAAATFTVM